MSRLRVLLVASALLTAGCGGAVTHSSSNAQPASFAGVDLNAGANAGANAESEPSHITNRPNPTLTRSGSTQTRPPATTTTKPAAPPAGEPAMGSGFDRCNGGIGVDLAGSEGLGPKRPLPECAVE